MSLNPTEIQKPFARFENWEACITEQQRIGHDADSAERICESIKDRAEKGTLYKGMLPLEILKATDELVVGGPASWEVLDYENDIVTTEAQVNFLTKFFSLPPEYRNISIDHTNFQIGTAMLQWPLVNPKYFSHVHEKGMYLIAKIRNDKLKHTQKFRRLIRDGVYKMFSISGSPLRCDGPCERTQRVNKVRKIYDVDPVEVGIVQEGMCPKAGPIEELKNKGVQFTDNTFSTNRFDSFDYTGTGTWYIPPPPTNFEKLKQLHKDMTWEECISEASKDPDVRDPEALCGWLRANKTKPQPNIVLHQEAERIMNKYLPKED